MRLFIFVLSTMAVTILNAQKEYAEDGISHAPYFTDTVKIWWLGIFALLVLYLVARTFRNKPEA